MKTLLSDKKAAAAARETAREAHGAACRMHWRENGSPVSVAALKTTWEEYCRARRAYGIAFDAWDAGGEAN